jgi:CDP-diacylglycerol--serine O-phosphatidyltransferase
MVSNLPYRSFKDLDLRRRWPVTTIFIIAIVVSLVTLTPHVLSIMAAVYVLSAPVALLTGRVRRSPHAAPDRSAGDGMSHAESADR